MRFTPVFGAVALLIPSLASANELLRAYELAVQNDAQIKAAAGARTVVTEGGDQSFGALLPQVNGSGSLTKGRAEKSFTFVDPSTSTTVTQSSDEPEESRVFSVRLRQALIDVAAWNRWQQSDAEALAAEANYRIAEQNLVLRTAEAYFNVLAASDSVRFADAEKKAVGRSLELAQRRFEVGLSAITDVQEAQARFDLTVAQMIEAEQALVSAELSLAEITDVTDLRFVPLRDEIPLLGPNPDSVGDWLKTASDNNLDIVFSRAQAEAAKQNLERARAGHYPSLAFVAEQSRLDSSGATQFGPTDADQDSYTYGLELNVPIFAGGATQAAVNSARGLQEQRVAELETRERAVERTTKNAYQGVIAGVSRVKALKQAVLSNTTALEASEVGLEVGARTAVDVLNAQRELYRAQRDYSRSRYDYLLNVLRLKAAAGQLSGKDLVEIDGLLEAPSALAG